MSQTLGSSSLGDSSQIFCGNAEHSFKDVRACHTERTMCFYKNSSSKNESGNSPNPLLHTLKFRQACIWVGDRLSLYFFSAVIYGFACLTLVQGFVTDPSWKYNCCSALLWGRECDFWELLAWWAWWVRASLYGYGKLSLTVRLICAQASRISSRSPMAGEGQDQHQVDVLLGSSGWGSHQELSQLLA